ncbi:ankyrin repeat-containing domain protein [Rhodocollybia butyracea]|uniref:Ankyrin repeat-containing domain protein n=1 Tax=Rhodocollybia butyracea TaxID=206335 RepID=A0A9P5PI79_9AGAR|nr:ankyrin repeat-containing domain protein [Rhodocollybia butyracea]
MKHTQRVSESEGLEENVNLSMFSGASNLSVHDSTFTNVAGDYNIITKNNYNYNYNWKPINIVEIRNWLKAPDPSTNFVSACDKKTSGTGEWIFSQQEYIQWCQGPAGLLWIQGKVGSGKTILSSTIIENLKANPAVKCYYYYFDNRDNLKTKTNARGLLQSLLLQMATRTEGGAHPALHELYTTHKQGSMEPTTKELSSMLVAVAKDLSPAFLILDAMDECSEANDVFKHLALLKDKLCIAVTSRYNAESSYGVSWSIHLDQAGRDFHRDVSSYLKDKLSHRQLKPDLFTEIVNSLTKGAQGQFRWVDCQVTVLQRCATPKAIRDALKKLPKTLEETYTVAIERLKTIQLLMWLAYAFKPLSIAAVTEILAVDLDAQEFDPDARTYDILDSTLITVNGEKVVQLAHNSVKEFLTQIQGQNYLRKLVEINEHLAHSTICQTCLIYLLQFDSEKIYNFWWDYPLAEYAAEYWPLHMERLQTELPESEHAKNLALALVKDSSAMQFVNWIRIHAPDQEDSYEAYKPSLHPSKISTPLLQSLTEYLLVGNMADVNAKGGRYGNALQAGAIQGNKDIVQLLLAHKADVNAQGGEYGNALQAASSKGDKSIVQLLLEHRADVNVQGGKYGNALQAAACDGSKGTVQILLENNADVNAQGGQYGSALQAAASQGDKDIVQLLLEHKADVNAQGGVYGNALQAAAIKGNKDTAQLLLEHRADVNAQGGVYGNALQAAAIKGNKDIVQLLLEMNADVTVQGGRYWSALHAAAYQGGKDIVQLLLEHKADVNLQGKYGSALQVATYRRNTDIVRLLLENKADVNLQGERCVYALQAAACDGMKDIVQILLEHGADVNAQGGTHGNALQVAALEGNLHIVQVLLEHKADVNAQGGEYGSALQAASRTGRMDIVQLLLEHKADVNAQGERMGLLLEHKADVNMPGGCYGNALQAAALQRKKDIVQLLLEHRADVNMQGGYYGTALQAASFQGTEDIVQLLLKHKADINLQGGEFRNALQAAAYGRNKHKKKKKKKKKKQKIVQLLLEHKTLQYH